MEAGIVGLPNVGKSTLFNALTSSKAAASENYPFCTIEPNEGIVCVPDDRLERITRYIIPQKVIRFRPGSKEIKVPHVGWNNISVKDGSWISENISGEYVYFVHSYFVEVGDFTIATTDYVQPFSAALQKDNFYATQFHPEKSGSVGEQILNNFLK